MNGKEHFFVTLIVMLVIGYFTSDRINMFYWYILTIGAVMSSNSSRDYGFNIFSPDIDLVFLKYGKNIHRKWYTHSYVPTIPLFLLSYTYIDSLIFRVFVNGVIIGWNLHVLEDVLGDYLKYRKTRFSNVVIATSIIGVIFGVVATLFILGNTEFSFVFTLIYSTLYFGVPFELLFG